MKKQTISITVILLLLCCLLCSCSSKKGELNSEGIQYAPNMPMDEMTAEIPSEKYSEIEDNQFLPTSEVSSQAFSLKVSTAAYSNVKRYLANGALPPHDAVRTEELINYFKYDTPMTVSGEHPFSVYTEVASSPFGHSRYMAFIRVKTQDIDVSELPPCNFTFLIDSSGSMSSYDKLPLLQQAFSMLADTLTERDTVSIVTYAGSSEVVLDSAPGSDKDAIIGAINSLSASGSTAGAGGIQKAYELAQKNFKKDANNRVILASDGDFNVGISNVDDLKNFISEKRGNGIYLSVLGFGTGNIRDDIMETLAANGNGNYSYIDSLTTAQKVLIDEMGSNLFTVADDVKAQINFNTENVKSFRLIGYENSKMSTTDFNDDKKDAGEIGMGTDVIVLIELELSELCNDGNLFDVCIRYKTPDKGESKELNLSASEINTGETSSDFNFACAVAGFCEHLRESEFKGEMTVEGLITLATENKGKDEKGYRAQFIEMLGQYKKIADMQQAQ